MKLEGNYAFKAPRQVIWDRTGFPKTASTFDWQFPRSTSFSQAGTAHEF